ncbi:MAG: alkaline phosphatase family protein [Lachnospiraceae bacterium]|nr:alkaline phosphatase family protein [Lachnospiraceae bacterium]
MKAKDNIVWPDYENCIANLPNSILKYWGLPTVGRTLPLADRYLNKEYKNVVLLLLDGMGKVILENFLAEEGPFRSHLAGIYKSVFLSTTVAATTSALSGLQPCEHSWLGWDCYYPQVDKNVTVFLNKVQGTEEPAADYNVAWTVTPYEGVIEQINKAGGKAYGAMPFLSPYPKSMEDICARIKTLCQAPDRKYIYAYWNQPDNLLHRNGCNAQVVKEELEKLECMVNHLVEECEDTLFLVTADHGHIDTEYVVLQDYPAICDCLVRLPSLEPRVLNFFVKEEKRNIFEEEFKKEFGDKFLLMPMEEAIGRNLFGTGVHHENFRGMLGNYLAIATGNLSIFYTDERFVSLHGSLTEDEMLIPLLVFET